MVLGDLANSRSCEEGFEWELKRLGGPPMTIATDSTGRAWLFVGTDSGFESRSAVYYTRFRAGFEPVSERGPQRTANRTSEDPSGGEPGSAETGAAIINVGSRARQQNCGSRARIGPFVSIASETSRETTRAS